MVGKNTWFDILCIMVNVSVRLVVCLVKQVCDEYFTKMRRQVYQTPKSYLSFLQLYKAMYMEKINELKVSHAIPLELGTVVF